MVSYKLSRVTNLIKKMPKNNHIRAFFEVVIFPLWAEENCRVRNLDHFRKGFFISKRGDCKKWLRLFSIGQKKNEVTP